MIRHPHTLTHFDSDAIDGWIREAPLPADDPQARIVLLGPELTLERVSEVIPTWAADTPTGSWVEIQLRAWVAGRWSRFYRIADWDSALVASQRTSFTSQQDDHGRVATDTLLLRSPAEAIQVRVLLCASPGADMPELQALTLCFTSQQAAGGGQEVGGASLPVAARLSSPKPSRLLLPRYYSQYLSFPGGAGWCSPTALAMTLAYWHAQTGYSQLEAFNTASCVPDLAVPMIFDPQWGGTGNWAFNTAYAASLGLMAYVTRMHSLEQVACWTAAGVPVPFSLAWESGELDNAPDHTAGHLILIIGFEQGYALVAEPASHDIDQIIRRYRLDQLQDCWQRNSGGTVYLLYPPGWNRPAPGLGDAWV
jgi:hypothetical protein